MHRIIKDNLEDYLDGRLKPATGRDLEAHLSGCAPCRDEVEEARRSSRWLQALAAADAPLPSPGFYLKVREGVAAAEGFSLWGLLRPAFRQLAFATFMLVALLGSYYLSRHSIEGGNTTAQLMLNIPVEREAPPAQPDEHANREVVMVALASPLGD